MDHVFFKLLSLCLLCVSPFLRGEEESGKVYEFVGHHLIASYVDCNHAALVDLENLEKIMLEACTASGVNVLSSVKHIFEPDGMTMVVLLAESHASIHTYPENGACFVDFFTCGHSYDASKFDAILTDYLKPKQGSRQMFLRHSGLEAEGE